MTWIWPPLTKYRVINLLMLASIEIVNLGNYREDDANLISTKKCLFLVKEKTVINQINNQE